MRSTRSEQGATALGFVFWPRSPRAVELERAGGDHRGAAVARDDGRRVRERADRARSARSRTRRADARCSCTATRPPAYADALDRAGHPRGDGASDDRRGVRRVAAGDDAARRQHRSGAPRRDGRAVDWSTRRRRSPRRRDRARRRPDAGQRRRARFARCGRIGVDVSSGVEASPGVKDFDKVARFLANARRAFEAMK